MLKNILKRCVLPYKYLNTFIVPKLKFRHDKQEYIRQTADASLFKYDSANEKKMLYDYRENAGSVDGHYFFQDIYVAKYILKHKIQHVYDIGSRIDGYISHLLGGGIKVTMIDIRPFPIAIENLDFIQGDATNLISINDNTLPVLTSLHALEHFGLGRYGDSVDYIGWKKALNSFANKVQENGLLIVSVPVGNDNLLVFNAHRIFAPITIYDEISDRMSLLTFTKIQDCKIEVFDFNKDDNVRDNLLSIQKTLKQYDCGIFIFKKDKDMG